MGTALPMHIRLEDVEDADLFQRAAVAALSGYCANPEIGLAKDDELAALAWNTAEAFMEERERRAEAEEEDAESEVANG